MRSPQQTAGAGGQRSARQRRTRLHSSERSGQERRGQPQQLEEVCLEITFAITSTHCMCTYTQSKLWTYQIIFLFYYEYFHNLE